MKFIDRSTEEDGIRWYLYDDALRIGVTSVLGIIVHPKLKNWFKNNSAEKIQKVSSVAADNGSQMHHVLECFLTQRQFNTTPAQEINLNAFKAWIKGHEVEVVQAEPILAHEKYLYAGQTDLVCMYDGKRELWDYKTGRVTTSHGWQLAAYKLAWESMYPDQPIEGMRVVQVKNGDVKSFKYEHIDWCTNAWLHALMIFKASMFNNLLKGIEFQGKQYQWTLDQVKFDVLVDEHVYAGYSF